LISLFPRVIHARTYMVTLKLNGEDREFEEPLTVAALLRALQVKSGAVAVEVNRRVVPKSQHDSHPLRSGDHVEVVTFVGGG
jgi:thiamine biosynthesis protein ThiS